MNNALICERRSCLPKDILLTLSPDRWLKHHQSLLNHLTDFSHLHCCTPKLLSHSARGLRKLFCRLANTPKHMSIPFLKTLLDLLYSLNPEGTWLVAAGMDYLIIQVKVLTLLSSWLQTRTDIKKWLLNLSSVKSKPLPRRKKNHPISYESWYHLPLEQQLVEPEKKPVPFSPLDSPVLPSLIKPRILDQQNQQQEIIPPSSMMTTDRAILLDSSMIPFQYRKIRQ